MSPRGQNRRKALLVDSVRAAIGEEAVAAGDSSFRQMHDARALTARGPEPGSIFAVSQHENIRRKTQTYLQPTLGRDNDPRE
jgi:hypothetical protein